MAVIFGDKKEGDWLRVTCIQWQMESHEDGYSIPKESVPEYPQGGFGVGYEMWLNTENRTFKFNEIKVPHTKEEALMEIAFAIKDLAQALKER
jgi:hypothetical protein